MLGSRHVFRVVPDVTLVSVSKSIVKRQCQGSSYRNVLNRTVGRARRSLLTGRWYSRWTSSCSSSTSGRAYSMATGTERVSSDPAVFRGMDDELGEVNTAATNDSIEDEDNKSVYSSLENLRWSPTFIAELPGDPSVENKVREVRRSLFSYVQPTPTGTEPSLVAFSASVCELIGIDESEVYRPEFSMLFSGNAPIPNVRAYAQCYGGHQFGSWAGQLGDGRAICLGEVYNPRNKKRWELQLKGAGKTPYSRMADGRAVLRSSLREFVASEAMSALGVPTTRALSLVATGDQVVRDMFYNGNPQLEPGAVVCRVAQSFIRFGTFQLPVSRGDEEIALAKQVADFCIRHFYPHCAKSDENGSKTGNEDLHDESSKYARFFTEVARRTGHLVAEWTRVGFVHGVLNTDNMSILGDTIDYGPYGWLERFDPDFTPNTTDLPGRRYSFRAQPEIGQWNLLQLARALVLGGLINEDQASDGLVAYGESLTQSYNDSMAKKLGLKDLDKELLNDLLKCMYEDEADYTNTFRALSSVQYSNSSNHEDEIPNSLKQVIGEDILSNDERKNAWGDWVKRYRTALRSARWSSDEERQKIQDATNPAIVPRNHVLVEIISAAENGDFTLLQHYLRALETPYNEKDLDPSWLIPGPARPRLGVELLSCSS